MTRSLDSRSSKPASPSFPVDDTVREVVAAMPIVIFANAIRDAFLRRRPAKAAPVATRTFRTR